MTQKLELALGTICLLLREIIIYFLLSSFNQNSCCREAQLTQKLECGARKRLPAAQRDP